MHPKELFTCATSHSHALLLHACVISGNDCIFVTFGHQECTCMQYCMIVWHQANCALDCCYNCVIDRFQATGMHLGLIPPTSARYLDMTGGLLLLSTKSISWLPAILKSPRRWTACGSTAPKQKNVKLAQHRAQESASSPERSFSH